MRQFGRARKARAGYTPLPEDEDAAGASQNNDRMPTGVLAAVANVRNARKPKRTEQYDGDEEEGETLLGEQSHDRRASEEHATTSSRVSVMFKQWSRKI